VDEKGLGKKTNDIVMAITDGLDFSALTVRCNSIGTRDSIVNQATPTDL